MVSAVLLVALPVLLIGTTERSGEVPAGEFHDAPPLTAYDVSDTSISPPQL